MKRLNLKSTLAIGLLLAVPGLAHANHALVNCGSPGYWDNTLPAPTRDTGSYVWLMNDNTVQIQPPNQDWIQLGAVTGEGDLAIKDINVDQLQTGQEFRGPNFAMKLTEEFIRPNQRKNRRFFRTTFTTSQMTGSLECVFGLK